MAKIIRKSDISKLDPHEIDRQECHAEHPAESGEQGDCGEPHLSDHDGGTDRAENNVHRRSAEGDDHVSASFEVSHVGTSGKTEDVEDGNEPDVTVSIVQGRRVR